MRIYYLTKINFSSERTNVYNTARTCEALNSSPNIEVTLVSTDRLEDTNTFFDRHHVTDPFRVVGLNMSGRRLAGSRGRLGRGVWLVRSNAGLGWFLIRSCRRFDMVYLRDESLAVAALVAWLMGKPVFFEVHAVFVGWHRQLLNRVMAALATGIVAISRRLAQYYQSYGKPMLVSYCGADESFWFDYAKSIAEVRNELNLPEDKILVGYAGVVGMNANNDVYENDHIVQALAHLPQRVVFVIVGERSDDAAWLRDVAREAGVADRVIIIPWRDRAVIPKYLRSFDVIVIPRRRKDLPSDSPLKMFSALSAGRPIVAGRSESITEVLKDGQNALVVRDNSPEGYAEKIRTLLDDTALAEKLGKQALTDSKMYTWHARGRDIANFVRACVVKTE